jgi:hypothetical protein
MPLLDPLQVSAHLRSVVTGRTRNQFLRVTCESGLLVSPPRVAVFKFVWGGGREDVVGDEC